MPSYLPRPRRGQRQTAASQREITRELDAARNWQGDGPVSFDATGTAVRFTMDYPSQLMLWEITGEWEACDGCDSSSSSSSSSSGAGDLIFPLGWCRVPAKPINYFVGDRTWDIEYQPDERYIFHPGGHPPGNRDDLVDYRVSMPRFGVGDWVWCVFNQQSGWWEIINGYEDVWRFELKTDLDVDNSGSIPQGGNALAYLRIGSPPTNDSSSSSSSSSSGPDDCGTWAACDVVIFTVCDSMGMFEGTGRDSGGLNARGVGSRGIAKYFADSQTWEIIQMECP